MSERSPTIKRILRNVTAVGDLVGAFCRGAIRKWAKSTAFTQVKTAFLRYVRGTEWHADKRSKKHLADALDLVAGQLYDWMRDVARRGDYVGVHVLQTGIIPAELEFYERYWIGQFAGLLNVRSNGQPAAASSDIARHVVVAIKAQLAMQGFEDQEA